jgi:hypothetical protein
MTSIMIRSVIQINSSRIYPTPDRAVHTVSGAFWPFRFAVAPGDLTRKF